MASENVDSFDAAAVRANPATGPDRTGPTPQPSRNIGINPYTELQNHVNRVYAQGAAPEDLQIDPEDEEFIYQFSRAHPGLAIIITYSHFNNRFADRNGAIADKRKMENVFKGLNFKVECLHNLDTTTLMARLSALARSDIMNHIDCLACVISSHGSENEVGKNERNDDIPDNIAVYDHYIMTTDNQVQTRQIMQLFDADHCRSLEGRPRLFFIQACRSRFDPNRPELRENAFDQGVEIDVTVENVPGRPAPNLSRDLTNIQPQDVGYSEISEGHQESTDDTQMDAKGTLPAKIKTKNRMFYEHTVPMVVEKIPLVPPVCLNHYLVMFTSISETVGWSDRDGGWLLSNLHDVFKKRIQQGSRFSLMKALVEVNRIVAQQKSSHTRVQALNFMKSMPCLESKLTKEIYFHPSIWPGTQIVR